MPSSAKSAQNTPLWRDQIKFIIRIVRGNLPGRPITLHGLLSDRISKFPAPAKRHQHRFAPPCCSQETSSYFNMRCLAKSGDVLAKLTVPFHFTPSRLTMSNPNALPIARLIRNASLGSAEGVPEGAPSPHLGYLRAETPFSDAEGSASARPPRLPASSIAPLGKSRLLSSGLPSRFIRTISSGNESSGSSEGSKEGGGEAASALREGGRGEAGGVTEDTSASGGAAGSGGSSEASFNGAGSSGSNDTESIHNQQQTSTTEDAEQDELVRRSREAATVTEQELKLPRDDIWIGKGRQKYALLLW